MFDIDTIAAKLQSMFAPVAGALARIAQLYTSAEAEKRVVGFSTSSLTAGTEQTVIVQAPAGYEVLSDIIFNPAQNGLLTVQPQSTKVAIVQQMSTLTGTANGILQLNQDLLTSNSNVDITFLNPTSGTLQYYGSCVFKRKI